MNKYFLLLIVITVLAACNNQSAEEKALAADTAITVVTKDTIPQKDTALIAFSYELTPAEMPDDSVFTDGSQPSSWANAGFDHPVAFKKFLKRLQYWVANNQQDSVAAVIAFPLKNPNVKNKAAFIEKYDSLINEKVKKALMAQNLRQIFRRDQGAMIGDGELWFNETKKGFSIITINN